MSVGVEGLHYVRIIKWCSSVAYMSVDKMYTEILVVAQ